MAADRRMLDTVLCLETPEGVELRLRPAGPVPRALAWTIDTLIRFGLYMVLLVLFAMMGRFGMGLFFISAFLVEWFYPVVFEVYGNGATPGKRALGLRVLHDDGTPVGWTASLVRNLLRFVDFLPFLYTFGLITMFYQASFKRLGDLAAGTLVVYREEAEPALQRGTERPVAPPYALTQEEQQALVELAERRTQLSPERGLELARLTGPLVEGASDPIARLAGMGNWVAGGR